MQLILNEIGERVIVPNNYTISKYGGLNSKTKIKFQVDEIEDVTFTISFKPTTYTDIIDDIEVSFNAKEKGKFFKNLFGAHTNLDKGEALKTMSNLMGIVDVYLEELLKREDREAIEIKKVSFAFLDSGKRAKLYNKFIKNWASSKDSEVIFFNKSDYTEVVFNPILKISK